MGTLLVICSSCDKDADFNHCLFKQPTFKSAAFEQIDSSSKESHMMNILISVDRTMVRVQRKTNPEIFFEGELVCKECSSKTVN